MRPMRPMPCMKAARPMSQILIRLPRNIHEALLDEAYHQRRSLNGICLEALIELVSPRLFPPVAEAACESPVTPDDLAASQLPNLTNLTGT
jgi:hypothetical protein